MGYNPDKPMEGRISDLGPLHYEQFFPPVIKENKGKCRFGRQDRRKPLEGFSCQMPDCQNPQAPSETGLSAGFCCQVPPNPA